LPVTGIVDARTRAALGPLGRPLFGERVLRRGAFGLDVSVLQVLLSRAGLYHGALDGYLDARTEAALRRYQRNMRLVPDGLVRGQTVARFVRRTGVPVRPTAPKLSPPKTTYVVRPGDTLTAIAGEFGLAMPTLARANKLDPDSVLLIGARLEIPAPALGAT